MRTALDRQISAARRRCDANLLLDRLGLVLVVTGSVVAAAAAVERALGIELLTAWSAWSLAAVAAAATVAGWLACRPGRFGVALMIDERLAFGERFSTALVLSDSADPFAQAAVAEAHDAAEGAKVSAHFPVRPTRRWLVAGAAWLAAGAVILFMPTMDLLGYLQQRRQAEQEQSQLTEVKVEVAQAAEAVKSAVSQLQDEQLAEQLAELGQIQPGAKPQEIRRQAIRKLGDLGQAYKQLQSGKPLASAAMMQQMLKKLRPASNPFSAELNMALASGDLARAASLIRRMQQQLESGKLDQANKQALAKQLENLADQLDKLAERDEQLADELEKAGLDKKLAQLSPEQLKKALSESGLSEEQIAELLSKAAASRACQGSLLELAGAMGAAGSGGLSGEELAELVEQLDDMEALQQELALTEAALAEIDRAISQLGQGTSSSSGGYGEWREGLSVDQSYGTGGPGRGYGAREEAAEETSHLGTRVKNKQTKGPIIASWYFKGSQIKGQARRDLAEVVQAGKDRAAEAISESRIPRKYESAVKRYFGQLEEIEPE